MNVDALLQTIPPLAVYLVVGVVIGLESLGIPLPGEIALVSAALLASRHTLDINPVAVGASATVARSSATPSGTRSAIATGSDCSNVSAPVPEPLRAGHVALAKQLFARWGVWACSSAASSRCCGSWRAAGRH
jgi:membrane protein DedA with SNARE-associated domain